MKKIVYLIGILILLVVFIPKVLWKIEVIDENIVLKANKPYIKDNLELWALNSRPFFVIESKEDCIQPTREFKIQVLLYSQKDIYYLTESDIDCTANPLKIKIISKSKIPKFKIFDKLEIVSTEELSDNKITWYNAQP